MLGYLLAVGAGPLLAYDIPWRQSLWLSGSFVVVVIGLRWYLGEAVHGVLSRSRARAVLRRVDVASVLLLAAAMLITWIQDARQVGDGWTLLALLAIASLLGTLIMLRQARSTWLSSSFLSRLESRQEPFAEN